MPDEIKIEARAGTGTAQLRVRWDGDVPGLAEHRVSLAEFGAALANLLYALRRIATQMVTTAMEHEQPRTGRFANVARQLDIELVSIEGNSSGFDGLVTFEQPQDMLPLFLDIPDRVTSELLESIEIESNGGLRNAAVRRYLNSLPKGVHKQVYEFHRNGDIRKRVEIGDVKMSDIPADLPYLREYEGNVVGVGFEPGRNEVRVKPEVGNMVGLASSAENVEQALEMRHNKVRTLTVHTSKGTRVIALKRASEPQFKFDPKSAKEHIFTRWDNVLRELSK